MTDDKRTARFAGLLYLIVVVTGIFNLMYVPSRLIDLENMTATVENIKTNELLFRFGILSGLLCQLAFLMLALALFRLFQPVDRSLAAVMALLVIVSVPISLISLHQKFEILTLLDPANSNLFAGKVVRETEVFLHLKSYADGNKIASIFWGLWLLPFGILVVRSVFIPKLFGVLLIIGCFGYLLHFLGSFLVHNYTNTLFSRLITIPGSLGEIGICLWLLVFGVRRVTVKLQTI